MRNILVGDGGGDTFIGGKGDDIYVGGVGTDIYVIEDNDRIVDEDGRGLLVDRNGRTISGTFIEQPNGTFQWTADASVTGTRNSRLTLTLSDGSTVVIETFQDNEFGIRLIDAPTTPVGDPFVGDLQDRDFALAPVFRIP